MQKITPHLWFDTQAIEAANFYSSVFDGAKILTQAKLHDTPSGDVAVLTMEILGQQFTFLNAGPYFKINPSVSFLVACKSAEEVETLYNKLAVDGTPLMELGTYPFSEKYGWIEDKYGVSWQIMHMGDRQVGARIVPTMMFIGENAGKAEEAINFYASIFQDSKIGDIMRYEEGESTDAPGTIKHASFTLEGQQFAAMDSAYDHKFQFNEAISFVISCKNQEEVDYYWNKLSAVPKSEECGWLKDKFGFSWQVEPSVLPEMLLDKDQSKVDRLTQAFLKMKKFDIEALQKAFDGE